MFLIFTKNISAILDVCSSDYWSKQILTWFDLLVAARPLEIKPWRPFVEIGSAPCGCSTHGTFIGFVCFLKMQGTPGCDWTNILGKLYSYPPVILTVK